MNYEDYWSPGLRLFVSITSTVSKPVTSVTFLRCQIVQSWDEAFEVVRRFLEQNRFYADEVAIFSRPRLCRRCMEHATQSLVFDITEHVEECLCVLIGTPCGVH